MTDLRTRTLRLLLAGALFVGVAGTATQAHALTQIPAELAPKLEPVDPKPPVDEPADEPADDATCDPEVELCAIPVDPNAVDCPEIPTNGGTIPDPGCQPPRRDCGELRPLTEETLDEPTRTDRDCPPCLIGENVKTVVGQPEVLDPDCRPCPVDEDLEPLRTDPQQRSEARRTNPCDPPVDVCDEPTTDDEPRLRAGDDDVVELRTDPDTDGRDECEPDRPNFTG